MIPQATRRSLLRDTTTPLRAVQPVQSTKSVGNEHRPNASDWVTGPLSQGGKGNSCFFFSLPIYLVRMTSQLDIYFRQGCLFIWRTLPLGPLCRTWYILSRYVHGLSFLYPTPVLVINYCCGFSLHVPSSSQAVVPLLSLLNQQEFDRDRWTIKSVANHRLSMHHFVWRFSLSTTPVNT